MASKSSLISLLLVVPIFFFAIYSPACVREVVDVFLNLGEEKMVFYVQETATGPNATVTTVAGVNGTSSNLSGFGSVFVIDDPVTQGSDNTSKILGRLQGLEGNSGRYGGPNYHMVSSIIFENGAGSLEIHGTIRTPLAVRELAVVGGTGQFRYARGYVLVEVVSFDA
ncbi:hypothetical protein KI387_017918, partial [Taxus chinensis]